MTPKTDHTTNTFSLPFQVINNILRHIDAFFLTLSREDVSRRSLVRDGGAGSGFGCSRCRLRHPHSPYPPLQPEDRVHHEVQGEGAAGTSPDPSYGYFIWHFVDFFVFFCSYFYSTAIIISIIIIYISTYLFFSLLVRNNIVRALRSP